MHLVTLADGTKYWDSDRLAMVTSIPEDEFREKITKVPNIHVKYFGPSVTVPSAYVFRMRSNHMIVCMSDKNLRNTLKSGNCYIIALKPGNKMSIVTKVLYNTTTKTNLESNVKSAIKNEDAYTWYEFLDRPSGILVTRRGKSSTIKYGDQIGIRSATTDNDKYRLIFRGHETLVYSIDKNTRDSLVQCSVKLPK